MSLLIRFCGEVETSIAGHNTGVKLETTPVEFSSVASYWNRYWTAYRKLSLSASGVTALPWSVLLSRIYCSLPEKTEYQWAGNPNPFSSILYK